MLCWEWPLPPAAPGLGIPPVWPEEPSPTCLGSYGAEGRGHCCPVGRSKPSTRLRGTHLEDRGSQLHKLPPLRGCSHAPLLRGTDSAPPALVQAHRRRPQATIRCTPASPSPAQGPLPTARPLTRRCSPRPCPSRWKGAGGGALGTGSAPTPGAGGCRAPALGLAPRPQGLQSLAPQAQAQPCWAPAAGLVAFGPHHVHGTRVGAHGGVINQGCEEKGDRLW